MFITFFEGGPLWPGSPAGAMSIVPYYCIFAKDFFSNIGNYRCGEIRKDNRCRDNSNNRTIGAIVLRDQGQVIMQQETIRTM